MEYTFKHVGMYLPTAICQIVRIIFEFRVTSQYANRWSQIRNVMKPIAQLQSIETSRK